MTPRHDITVWPQVKPRAGEAPRLPVHQIHVDVPQYDPPIRWIPAGHSDLHALYRWPQVGQHPKTQPPAPIRRAWRPS